MSTVPNKPRLSWKHRAVSVIFIGLVVAALWWLYANRETVRTIAKLDVKYLVAVIIVSIVGLAGRGWLTNHMMLRPFGVKTTVRDWWGLATSTALASVIIPLPAYMAIKPIFFKKMYGLRISSYTAVMLAQGLLAAIVASVCGLILMASLDFTGVRHVDKLHRVLLLTTFGPLTVLFIILWLKPAEPEAGPGFRKWLARSALGLRLLVKNKPTLVGILGMNVFLLAIDALRAALMFRALSIELPWSYGLLIGVFARLALVQGFLPSGVGIYEFVIILISPLMALDKNVGILVAISSRAAVILVIVPLGLWGSYLMRRRLGNAFDAQDAQNIDPKNLDPQDLDSPANAGTDPEEPADV